MQRVILPLVILWGLLCCSWPARAGETLYNGILLPDVWSPRPEAYARREPIVPPYLHEPPKVIPIDVGRQLFVDDGSPSWPVKRSGHFGKRALATACSAYCCPYTNGVASIIFGDGVQGGAGRYSHQSVLVSRSSIG